MSLGQQWLFVPRLHETKPQATYDHCFFFFWVIASSKKVFPTNHRPTVSFYSFTSLGRNQLLLREQLVISSWTLVHVWQTSKELDTNMYPQFNWRIFNLIQRRVLLGRQFVYKFNNIFSWLNVNRYFKGIKFCGD